MRVLVSALEPSSNLHLQEVCKHLDGSVEIMGIFDASIPELSAFKPLYSPLDFSVMGFTQVLTKIPFLMRARKQMIELAKQADKVLLMDASSFNIPLAKAIKMQGLNAEVIYYILPQVWVWKAWRSKILEQYCDRLAAILPFEVACYQSKATFIGHPLLDELPSAVPLSDRRSKEIAFLPGSRKGEIKYLFPIFRDVAHLLRQSGYNTTLVVPHAFEKLDWGEIYGDIEGFDVEFDAPHVFSRCAFAFICSGTATLQASLLGTPFVLAYRTRALDYWIASQLIKIPSIGLGNIFFEKMGKEPFHIELRQNQVSTQELLEAFNKTDPQVFFAAAQTLREYLKQGSSKTLAEWLCQ